MNASEFTEHSQHCGNDIVAVRLVKEGIVTSKFQDPDNWNCDEGSGVLPAETEKQRLTREAWQRHKAKHPDPIPFVPMRENEQYEIAAAALAEHDLVWPVRKK